MGRGEGRAGDGGVGSVSILRREHPEGCLVRIWDYVDGDLAERQLAPDVPAPCVVLGLWWVTVLDERWGSMLRLAHDAEGRQLVQSRLESEIAARRAEAEGRQAQAETLGSPKRACASWSKTLAALRTREG